LPYFHDERLTYDERGMAMAGIKVRFGEFEFDCETVEDAARLTQALRGTAVATAQPIARKPKTESPNGTAATKSTPDYASMWGELGDEARRCLAALAESGEYLDTNALATAMQVDPQSIKYKLKSIRAIVARHGIEPDDVVSTQPFIVEGKPKSRYFMLPKVKSEVLKLI
jgi:hypothetical protein